MSATRTDSALALLRVVTGLVFMAHGAQKAFSYGIAGVTGSFESMGIPFATVTAPVVTGVELIGGFALVIGAFTPIVALLIAADMAGAFFFVHMANGFFAPKGVEMVTILGTIALALAIAGPGAYSVDAIRARRSA